LFFPTRRCGDCGGNYHSLINNVLLPPNGRYRIIFSNDQNTWYCFCDTIYTWSSSGWADHTFPAVSYRYVGVQLLNRAMGMNNYSFWEYEAYDTAGRAGAGSETSPEVGSLQILADE
jgi:hypothetical protein